MIETRTQNPKLLSLLNSHDPTLLIPELKIVNAWEINGNVKVIFLYVKHPKPLFQLEPLHDCLKLYLEENGVDSGETTLVGKELHKYQPRPILSLDKFKMNPRFISGNVKHLYAQRLTLRASSAGITFCFWTRACCLYIFKGYEVKNPAKFVKDFLNETVNYPQYLIEVSKKTGKIRKLLWDLNTSRDYQGNYLKLIGKYRTTSPA